MKHSEFWLRMDEALGSSYSRVWADTQSLTELSSRTVNEALNAGETVKSVWRAVHSQLQLPERDR